MSFTGLMIGAFRLFVWKLFVLILGSILYKTCRTLCFPFRQTSAICCFFGRSRCFRCCVISIWWLLSSKERVQWALHLFPFQRTLAYVLIHQRKIDKDLLNKITKATILYPTVHFVSSRTQNFIQQENLVLLAFGRDKNPHDVLWKPSKFLCHSDLKLETWAMLQTFQVLKREK